MFKGLRIQLTLLYTLSALALIGLVGGGGYLIVARYFQGVTDLALQHKMTHEFHSLAAPIPIELIPADRDWSTLRMDAAPLGGSSRSLPIRQEVLRKIIQDDYADRTISRIKLDEKNGHLVYEVYFSDQSEIYLDAYSGELIPRDAELGSPTSSQSADSEPRGTSPASLETSAYDAELSAIFVLPLDAHGRLLFDPNPYISPLAPNIEALQVALAQGSDLRTVTTADAKHVRLLTYKLTRSDGPAALQLGRVLTDQEHVLSQLLVVMLILSGVSVVLLGAGSWWLAGRGLSPAQQAWERQQSFIANASHELRTPLTLIRASAEVALRVAPESDHDQRELLGDVLSEADHMRRLVDDLLTLSRIDSGRLKLERRAVNVPELLSDIQRQVGRVGEDRGVEIRLSQVSGVAMADPDRLRQVLLILLDNALRYTSSGGQITLSAETRGQVVQIQVADSGSGIPAEHLPHVFERFYRADTARGVSGNAGLGLPIARGLVEAQQGKLSIASTLGVGTSVSLTLQASPAR